MFYPLYAIRYMRATRHTLYAIQATSDEFASTTVENPLQISSFMQNKPNQSQYNANQTQYKPNTKPNKANFRDKKSSWGGNDRIEQSAIPYNSASNICRLTAEFIRPTMLPNRFRKGLF